MAFYFSIQISCIILLGVKITIPYYRTMQLFMPKNKLPTYVEF